MLQDLAAGVKKVYEISGIELDKGVTNLNSIRAGIEQFDLALSCHVLEHVNDPHMVMQEVISLVKKNGHIYLELPNEKWRQAKAVRFQGKLIKFMIRWPALLRAADFIFTAMRIKCGWIPSFGFVVIREHLQYFNLSSIKHLMSRCGLEDIYLRERGQFLIAVGRKL